MTAEAWILTKDGDVLDRETRTRVGTYQWAMNLNDYVFVCSSCTYSAAATARAVAAHQLWKHIEEEHA